MLVLLNVLIGTNLMTLGVLGWHLLRPILRPAAQPAPDAATAAAVTAALPGTSTSAPRRVITIEILNPLQLAGTRGRWVGIAGSLAPGITRRLVYDQAVRTVKRQLAAEQVVADVRVHEFGGPPPR